MFKNNEYRKEYFRIIKEARLNPPKGYCEVHHIIPRSFGGTDYHRNLVKVSGADHLRLHTLLPYFTEGEYRDKMLYAWNYLTHKGKITDYEEYQYLKEEFSKSCSRKYKGKNNPMYGVDSVTVRDLRDNAFKRVPKEDFEKYDYYIGASKGMDYYQDESYRQMIVERNSDRIHIHDPLKIPIYNESKTKRLKFKSKMVKPKDLIWYLADGWKIGRLPFKTFTCEYCGREMTVNNKTQHTRKCQREHSL